MKRLLVFRFSAMGDVALLAPAVRAIAAAYPDRELTVVTRARFGSFFEGIPGVRIAAADLDGIHKGIPGLYRLFRELQKAGPVEYVIDTHQNLRTSVLKLFFRLAGVPSVTLDKGRDEKKALTRKENKVFRQLPHSVERYLATFARAGFSAVPGEAPYFPPGKPAGAEAFLQSEGLLPKTKKWVGIAPFAQHEAKMWPLDRFPDVMQQLREKYAVHFFLFGGGKAEIEQLERLKAGSADVTVVAGKLSLSDELALLPRLDLMICMDSGNMHLAALSGVPVLSIWGGTHPFAGFGPWGQAGPHILQVPVEELPCRPCSVFGNKPCWRGDLACMTRIGAEQVSGRAAELLGN